MTAEAGKHKEHCKKRYHHPEEGGKHIYISECGDELRVQILLYRALVVHEVYLHMLKESDDRRVKCAYDQRDKYPLVRPFRLTHKYKHHAYHKPGH